MLQAFYAGALFGPFLTRAEMGHSQLRAAEFRSPAGTEERAAAKHSSVWIAFQKSNNLLVDMKAPRTVARV